MKRKPDCQNGITKVERLFRRVIEELEYSKEINRDSKRSYEEAIQQKKKEFTRTKGRRQHVARGQKYPIESTLKEAELEKIWTF